jgi:hypothetical protein
VTKALQKIKSRDVAAFDPVVMSPQQQAQLCEIAKVDLSGSPETLAALGAEELARAEVSVLRAGAYFLQLKQQAGHGGFLTELEKLGVSPDAAQRSMQIARYIAQLPADQARRIAAMPRTKALPLINADQEVVQQLLDEGSLDGDTPLSVRELRDRLAKAEKDKANLETQRDTARDELKRMRDRTALRAAESHLPPFALRAREDVAAITEQMDACLDALQVTYSADLAGEVADKHQDAANDAAGTFFHALRGIVGRSESLMRQIAETYGDTVIKATRDSFTLTKGEAQVAIDARAAMIKGLQADQYARDADRANTTPGKRGRKRNPKAS